MNREKFFILTSLKIIKESVIPLSQQIGKKARKCHSGKRSASGIGELYYKMYAFFRLQRPGKDSGQAGMTYSFRSD